MSKKFVKFMIFLILIGVFTIFYAFKIEPRLLIVKEVEIQINENAENEMRIVIFSDTHFTSNHSLSYTQKIVDTINEQNPEVVMFLGDLIDDYSNDPIDIDFITEEFDKIKGEKFAIMGNHDYGGGAENVYRKFLVNAGFQLLINESVIINDVKIIGIDDMIFGEPNFDIIDEIEEDENVLVMLHEGDMINDLNQNFDMAFGGHSHGGQIALPFMKNKIVPPGAEQYIKGQYEKIFVTSGIGTTLIHARLFCMPEIVVVTLKY